MQYKKIVQALIFVSGGIFSVSSMAMLNIYSNAAVLAHKEHQKGQYSFTQEGLSPEKTHVVQASVDKMPLKLALHTLIGDGWLIDINQSAKNMPVSFKGGESWPYILENISIHYHLKTHIDWKYRIVTVFSAEARNEAIEKIREKLILEQKEKMKKAQDEFEKAKKDYNSQQNETQNAMKGKKEDNIKTKNYFYSHPNMSKREQYLFYKKEHKGFPYSMLTKNAPHFYTVQKGDTLWDLSGTYLNNPWFWPEIWSINPEIQNPHLIYPGENITIKPRK